MPPGTKKDDNRQGAGDTRAAAEDPRGIQFGTAVVYDDHGIYGGGGNGDADAYVTELPTAAEEEAAESGALLQREQEELADEGRVSNYHPSTRMAQQSVRACLEIECAKEMCNE